MSGEVVDRVRGHWRTTAIGILVLAFALAMTVLKTLCWLKITLTCDFNMTEIFTAWALGYSFLMAKDSLLEGISLGLFKIKK